MRNGEQYGVASYAYSHFVSLNFAPPLIILGKEWMDVLVRDFNYGNFRVEF